MRFLFTTQPGHGHLYPLVPIARCLEEARHEVRVACAASFLPRVERAGLTGLAAGLDWLESAPEQLVPEVEAMSPSEREALLVELFVGTSAQHMAADLLEICEAWRPDVIVRDTFEYGGCVVGERLDIPHVPVDMELYIPPHISRDGMESELAYLRSALDLPPYPSMKMLTRYGYLSTVPKSYQFPDYRLPEETLILQPALPKGGDAELPEWVHHLPPRPTVYATMGTSFNNVPEIMRQIIAGLGQEEINLIITVGPGQDPRQFDPLPENVHVEQFIPQAALMPHCDLVIANGGVGTVMIALASGLPLLLIPLSGHLLLHARRCRELGIGLSLKLPEGLYEGAAPSGEAASYVERQAQALAYDDAPMLSPLSLRETTRELLSEPRYREAAGRLQAEINALPGAEHAVPFLEHLACLP